MDGQRHFLVKFIIAITVTWGAPILLIFQWRRLTRAAVLVQVIATILLIGVIPYVIPSIESLRMSPALTVMTTERISMVSAKATEKDVTAGRAKQVGEKISKEHLTEAVPLFFEDGVVRKDPSDLTSPKEGIGRFNIEVYFLSLLGVNVANFTPPMVMAVRFSVDALLPILILIAVSYVTPRGEKEKLARFYARLKTPVGASPEADIAAVEASHADPTRFDHTKLFPKSDWEFTKWDKVDAFGFLACGAFVGVVLLVLKGLMVIGS